MRQPHRYMRDLGILAAVGRFEPNTTHSLERSHDSGAGVWFATKTVAFHRENLQVSVKIHIVSADATEGSDMAMGQHSDLPGNGIMDRTRVIAPTDGDILGAVETVRDRFVVEAQNSGGGFALVEHLMPPRTLAAPLHRHSREDEYSFVIEGRIGAHFDGVEVFANTGDLILKPRGEWHTFWNAGSAPARILEIISPGGFEQAFRAMHALGTALDPPAMARIAADYGVDVDFDATVPIVERHKLAF